MSDLSKAEKAAETCKRNKKIEEDDNRRREEETKGEYTYVDSS